MSFARTSVNAPQKLNARGSVTTVNELEKMREIAHAGDALIASAARD